MDEKLNDNKDNILGMTRVLGYCLYNIESIVDSLEDAVKDGNDTIGEFTYALKWINNFQEEVREKLVEKINIIFDEMEAKNEAEKDE